MTTIIFTKYARYGNANLTRLSDLSDTVYNRIS